MTAREEAEAIWQIGEELASLLNARVFARMSPAVIDRWNAVPNVEHIDTIAKDISELGEALCGECDAHEEAQDRRRDSPLAPDYRGLAQ